MEMGKTVAKWMRIALKVASSMLGANGFALLLFSTWMAKVCLSEGRYSWFLLACVSVGSCLCAAAFFGYSAAADSGKQAWLTYHLGIMLGLLIVEILVSADINLNSNWIKDFPKDQSGLFKDFVKYVNDHRGAFRFMWLMFLLSQVASFVIAAKLFLTKEAYKLSIDDKALCEENKQDSIPNKDIAV